MQHFLKLTGLFLILILSSCVYLENLFDREDEADEIVEIQDEDVSAPEPGPEQIPEPELPGWYDPQNPVSFVADTIHVTVSAIAADSTDALGIAHRTAAEFGQKAFTRIIDEILENPEQHGFNPEITRDNAQLVDLLVFDARRAAEEIPYEESVFLYRTENNVRFYIKRSYLRSDMIEVLRSVYAGN